MWLTGEEEEGGGIKEKKFVFRGLNVSAFHWNLL